MSEKIKHFKQFRKIKINREMWAKFEDIQDRKKKSFQKRPGIVTQTNKYGYVATRQDLLRHRSGDMGEAIFQVYYDIPDKCVSDGEYDYNFKGLKIEIKSSTCAVPPRMDWEVWVNSPHFNKPHKQRCDMYVIIRILVDEEGNFTGTAYIIGWIPQKEFWKIAEFAPMGSVRKMGRGEVKLKKSDAYIVYFRNLYDISLFDEHCRLNN